MDQDFPKGKTRAELLLILHRQSCLLALGDAMREETKLHGPGFIKCKLCHVTTWLADNPGSKTAHLDNCPVAAWDKERRSDGLF